MPKSKRSKVGPWHRRFASHLIDNNVFFACAATLCALCSRVDENQDRSQGVEGGRRGNRPRVRRQVLQLVCDLIRKLAFNLVQGLATRVGGRLTVRHRCVVPSECAVLDAHSVCLLCLCSAQVSSWEEHCDASCVGLRRELRVP